MQASSLPLLHAERVLDRLWARLTWNLPRDWYDLPPPGLHLAAVTPSDIELTLFVGIHILSLQLGFR